MLGMPLHTQRERFRISHAYSLDNTIIAHRFDNQPVGGLVDGLGMQRVDHNFRRARRQFHQESTLVDGNWVALFIVLLRRQVAPHAVVVLARKFVDILMQCSAESDIEFLSTAAYGEQRYAMFDRFPDQRQRGRIALGIVRCAFTARIAAIIMWLDVGGGAGQEEPVQAVKEIIDIVEIAERGDQNGQTSRAVDDRGDVLVADSMKDPVVVAVVCIGRDADNR